MSDIQHAMVIAGHMANRNYNDLKIQLSMRDYDFNNENNVLNAFFSFFFICIKKF